MSDSCEVHPNPLEYWCQDDCMLVCKDCLIFGEHKAHNAVKQEQRRLAGRWWLCHSSLFGCFRSAAVKDRLGSLLPSLQAELVMSMEAGRQIEIDGSVQLSKVKVEVESWLDEAFLQEKRKMVSILF